MCVCVCVCVCARVRACVRACVCVRARACDPDFARVLRIKKRERRQPHRREDVVHAILALFSRFGKTFELRLGGMQQVWDPTNLSFRQDFH